MRPTIVAGDRIKADMKAYQYAAPQLGDLALFVPVGQPDKRWVFRIAGVPGDVLAYDEGVLIRNDEVVTSSAIAGRATFGPVSIADNLLRDNGLELEEKEYFLLSDDPDHYNDSRAWGPVHFSNILGKVVSHR